MTEKIDDFQFSINSIQYSVDYEYFFDGRDVSVEILSVFAAINDEWLEIYDFDCNTLMGKEIKKVVIDSITDKLENEGHFYE